MNWPMNLVVSVFPIYRTQGREHFVPLMKSGHHVIHLRGNDFGLLKRLIDSRESAKEQNIKDMK
jgi:hypothetical protein